MCTIPQTHPQDAVPVLKPIPSGVQMWLQGWPASLYSTHIIKFLNQFHCHWPSAVATDTNNLVYVSRANNHSICIFTPEGQLVHSFGYGVNNSFRCLAVNDNGAVCVCNSGKNNVVLFLR